MDKKACPHEFLMRSSCFPQTFNNYNVIYCNSACLYYDLYVSGWHKKDSHKTLNSVLQESSVIRILFVSTGFLSDIRWRNCFFSYLWPQYGNWLPVLYCSWIIHWQCRKKMIWTSGTHRRSRFSLGLFYNSGTLYRGYEWKLPSQSLTFCRFQKSGIVYLPLLACL